MNDVSDFETKIKRIEEIVSILEKGGIPLAESLHLYEEGIEAVSSCMETLKSAKMKIEKVGSSVKTDQQADFTPEES